MSIGTPFSGDLCPKCECTPCRCLGDSDANVFIPQDIFGEFHVEYWAEDEYVITCKAGPIGGTLHRAEAERLALWLNGAIPEAIRKLNDN